VQDYGPHNEKQIGVHHPQRSELVTTALKAGNPLPAADINGEVMNAETNTEKHLNLANRKSQVMQMKALSLSWASKPPDVRAELGIPRS
jgi:hypothetical protein